jgi:hypothetical protein
LIKTKKRDQNIQQALVSNSYLGLEDITTFIFNWNNKFPLDRWYRRKYDIPFNSKEHRDISLLDILIDYQEDFIFRTMPEDLRQRKKDKEDYLKTGKYLRPQIDYIENPTEEEVDEWFENLDVRELNKNLIQHQNGKQQD